MTNREIFDAWVARAYTGLTDEQIDWLWQGWMGCRAQVCLEAADKFQN